MALNAPGAREQRELLATSFQPSRRASRSRRRAMLIVGPLLWLASLVVVSLAIHHSNSVEYALLVLAISFVVALGLLASMRLARGREEQA